MRRDAPGLNALKPGRIENVSRSFHAHREPQPPKVFGASSARVSAHLAIIPFLAKRTEPEMGAAVSAFGVMIALGTINR
jgi:hypothetical protein